MASQKKKYQEYVLKCLNTSNSNIQPRYFTLFSEKKMEQTEKDPLCEVLKQKACHFCICCKGCNCEMTWKSSGAIIFVVLFIAYFPLKLISKISKNKSQMEVYEQNDPETKYTDGNRVEKCAGNIIQHDSTKSDAAVPFNQNQKENLIHAIHTLQSSGLIDGREAKALQEKISLGIKSLSETSKHHFFWTVCRYMSVSFLLIATVITLMEGPGLVRQAILLPFTFVFGVDAFAKAMILWSVSIFCAWQRIRCGNQFGDDFLLDILIALFFMGGIGAWNLMFIDTGNWNNETSEDSKGSELWWKWTSMLSFLCIGSFSHHLKSECLWYMSLHVMVFAYAVQVFPIFEEDSELPVCWQLFTPPERLACFLALIAFSLPKIPIMWPPQIIKKRSFELFRFYFMISLWLSAFWSYLKFQVSEPTDFGFWWRLESIFACICTGIWAVTGKDAHLWRLFLYGSTLVFVCQTWPIILFASDSRRHLSSDEKSTVRPDYWLGMNIPVRLSFFFAAILGLSSSKMSHYWVTSPQFRKFTSQWASNYLMLSLWFVSIQGNYSADSWAELLDYKTGMYDGRKWLLPWSLPLLIYSLWLIFSGHHYQEEQEAATSIYLGLLVFFGGSLTQICLHLLQVLTWSSLFFLLSLCAFVVPNMLRKLLGYLVQKSRKVD